MNRNYPLAIMMVLARTELARDNATSVAKDALRERDELVQELHEAMSELARMRLAVNNARLAVRPDFRKKFDAAFDVGMRVAK